MHTTRTVCFLDESWPFAKQSLFSDYRSWPCRRRATKHLFLITQRRKIPSNLTRDWINALMMLWENLCLRHWLDFSSLHTTLLREVITLNTNWLQTFKEPVKFSNWWYFGVIVEEKLAFKNCKIIWVAKALMSSYILCKFECLNPRRTETKSS